MDETGKKCDFYDVYEEIRQEIGLENMKKIYNLFKGQQINFPLHLYKPESVKAYIAQNSEEKIDVMSRKFGYSERWIRQLKKDSTIY